MLERFYKMNLLKVVLISAVALAAPAYSAELVEQRPIGAAVQEVDIFDACDRGDLAAVTAYLDNGGNVDACDRDGRSLLFLGSNGNSNLPFAKLLIERGADVNITCEFRVSPLMQAVAKGHLGILQLLLESGANPNVSQTGYSVLSCASCFAQPAVVEALLKYGASHDDLNGKQHAFKAACSGNRLDTMKILHNHETNYILPSQYDDLGASLLFEVCKNEGEFSDLRRDVERQISIVKQLSAFGFPIHELDADNRTPISYLSAEYHAEIIDVYMTELRVLGSYI